MNKPNSLVNRLIATVLAATFATTLFTVTLLTAGSAWADGLISSSRLFISSDKGNFQYSQPSDYPDIQLDLTPIEETVAAQASERCGTALAAAPLDLGKADGFMKKVAGKAAKAVVGQLLGGVLGGGGKQDKPDLYKDPIKKKYKEKINHPDSKARIQVGGELYQDGLLISAKIDKAPGKGTFHTLFLERPDCTRIWPEQYLGYGLWGSWSLSVSVTKTTNTYRDGKLVDSTSSHDSWSKSGKFDFSRGFSLWDQLPGEERKMILNADRAYLTQLRREIGVPAWQEMGYAKPTEGIRSAGGLFRISPDELSNGTIAVIHITEVDDGRYKTVGFPLRFTVGDKGRLSFAYLDDSED